MYKHILKIGALALFIIIVLLTMLSWTSQPKLKYIKIAQDLISQRIYILEDYFSCNKSRTDTIKSLKGTCSGNLLAEDILNVEKLLQTDIEEVASHNFLEMDITYADENIICGLAGIEWTLSALDGKIYQESHYYSFICENQSGSYKLIQFF